MKKAFTKTIGPKSAYLLTQLQKDGRTIFTSTAFCSLYGKSRPAAGDFLSELVKRGLIARIKAGVYLILKTGQENTQLKNWPVIAREIAGRHSCFISHYSAMRLYGMTSHPILDVYITVHARVPGKKLNDIKYHFIYSKKEHFWGLTTHWVTKQEQVTVSDLERTILDGLDRPDISGGVIDVIRGMWVKQKDIDWEKLVQYAGKFKTKAAVKRLGFILELLNLGNEKILKQMLDLTQNSKGYVIFDPDGAKTGDYLNRWGLRLNCSIEELKASVWG